MRTLACTALNSDLRGLWPFVLLFYLTRTAVSDKEGDVQRRHMTLPASHKWACIQRLMLTQVAWGFPAEGLTTWSMSTARAITNHGVNKRSMLFRDAMPTRGWQ